MIHEISPREKWSAISTLLWEVALLIFAAAILMMLLGIVSNLVAHLLFGYPWAWGKAHVADWLLFSVLVATPLLLMGGLVWMALRDEYQRILRTRMRKW